MYVPDPFLHNNRTLLVFKDQVWGGGGVGGSELLATDAQVRCHVPGTRSHPRDRGAGGVVAVGDRTWFTAQWGSAVCGPVCPSSPTSHGRQPSAQLSLLFFVDF